MTIERKVRIVFVAAFVLLIAVGGFGMISVRLLIAGAGRINRGYQAINTIAHLQDHWNEAQSARRGYVLVGDNPYRQDFAAADVRVQEDILVLERLMEDDPRQRKFLDAIGPPMNESLALLEKSISVAHDENWPGAQNAITLQSRALERRIPALLESARGGERELLGERNASMENQAQKTIWAIGGAGGIALALLILASIVCVRSLARRKSAGEELAGQAASLERSNWELRHQEREMALLGRMTDLVHSSTSTELAFRVFAEYGPLLFPDDAGCLFVAEPPRGLLHAKVNWGEIPAETFEPEDCWSLRRGQVHAIIEAGPVVGCRHLDGRIVRYSLCVPILAQGQALGMLHLERPAHDSLRLNDAQLERRQQSAMRAAEQIGLFLNNLNLQETLRALSTRDPVTDLFNRRYMEESLGRELNRVSRKKLSLAVLLLDIDRFKSFNDSFGHESGDAVLRTLAEFFRTSVRAEDIACRYGGEEFALILPETSLDIARERAEQLREGVKKLTVTGAGGQLLPPVTLSLGISAFPLHAETPQALLRAADVALYRAKRDGRDRAVVYDEGGRASEPFVRV